MPPDAVGNALGQGLADASAPADTTQLPTGEFARADREVYALQQSIGQSDAIQSRRFAAMDAYTPASEYTHRNGMDVASDNFYPASLANYRNAMDVASDQAYTARRLREAHVRQIPVTASWAGGAGAGRGYVNPAEVALYNSAPFAGRSTLTDPRAYVTAQQRDIQSAAMSNEPAENYSSETWKAEARDYKVRQGKNFSRDSIYNGLWTKGAQLDMAAGYYNGDALDQAAGVGIEAGAHTDMGVALARGAGSGIGRVLNAVGANKSDFTTPVIGSGVTPQGGVDLELRYKEGWTAEQRAAADAKVRFLTEAPTVVTNSNRSGTSAAVTRYKTTENVPRGVDVDHMQDLQLGGSKGYENLGGLDSSVNKSLGAQIQQQIKNLPIGTQINKVTIRY